MGGGRGTLAWGALALAGLLATASNAAAVDRLVRVRVYAGGGPVRIEPMAGSGGAPVEVKRSGDDLRLDGGERRSEALFKGPARLDGTPYRGSLRVRPAGEGLQVVNELSLEQYVDAILAREVYPTWNQSVLRAQAVVARTYALYHLERRQDRAYDVTAGADSQVYGGMAAETAATRRAVRATRGEHLIWRGEPILAVYHASSGGRTAAAREVWGRHLPYLVSVDVDGEEESPKAYWRIPASAATLRAALDSLGVKVGHVTDLRVSRRSESGRVLSVAVQGSRGTADVKGRRLRRAVGPLPSTLFEIRPATEADRADGEDADFVFVGAGSGHGVGLSQWGARAMAKRGMTYPEILAWFYPGTELRRAPEMAEER